MLRPCSQACWVVWVAIEASSVSTKFCQHCVAIEIQCRDRVWGWARLESKQGSPCIATEFSQGWDIPVATKDFMSRQGFLRVVLQQGVFLSRPIGQTCAHDRVLGARTTRLGTLMNERTRVELRTRQSSPHAIGAHQGAHAGRCDKGLSRQRGSIATDHSCYSVLTESSLL